MRKGSFRWGQLISEVEEKEFKMGVGPSVIELEGRRSKSRNHVVFGAVRLN